jgi:hypothetical protein
MDSYRREARRIRAAYRGDPVAIHRHLARLAAHSNPVVENPGHTDWSTSAILGHRGPAARQFADLVATQMVGPLLPWYARRTLLREAAKWRISLFEANLIIATVQHRYRRDPLPIAKPARPRAATFLIGTAIAAEALLVGIAWHFLSG